MSDEFPPLAALPQLTLDPSVDPDHVDAAKIVNDWFSSLMQSLSSGQSDNISELFLEKESWWRDFISFAWDIACHNGADAICKYLGASVAKFKEPKANQPGALQPHLANLGGMRFIQSGFSFKTNFGVGRGVLRLANVGPDQWKAWTVFTVLERLKEEEGESQSSTPEGSLQVLIVGAGQSGLALAAHLQALGLKYLVVDKAAQPGHSWRARYDTIKLHTPIYTDHYPFMKYPSDWPRWLDQEHVVKWMKHYGESMGLNITHGTSASKIEYNESTQRYSVELQSESGIETINPKHLVLATGIFDEKPIRPNFPGEDLFKGQIYHTADHKSAALVPDIRDKKITIIGSATSAHDIAEDFVNNGAQNVTMVQRRPIYVVSRESVESVAMQQWATPGVSLEDSDLLGNSLPTAVVRAMGVGGSQMMSAMDKTMLDGLEKAGMKVKRGTEGDSVVDHQYVRVGSFYIDQGACQMIIDGRIQVRACDEGAQEYYPDGIILGDGTKIESDLVILATGFQRNVNMIARLMGQKVIDKVGGICELDDSQERIGVWRPTGTPGFWFTTGSFMWSRQFAPILALQIAAIEKGLNSYDASQ